MSRTNSLTVIPESLDGQPCTVVHQRKQMPVGQGGFHVGALRPLSFPKDLGPLRNGDPGFQDARILYAYDCGSEPKANVIREIKSLAATVSVRHLDVLALSHFDRDHICGTPRLLAKKAGFTVDTIILPFVDDDERVIALARAAAATEDFQGRIDSFFVRMVLDPVATLSELGARRIILVRGDDDDSRFPEAAAPDTDPGFRRKGPDEAGTVEWRFEPGDPKRPLEIATTAHDARTQVMEVRNAALVASDHSGSIFWKLRPYVRAAKPAEVAAFRTAVEHLFGWKAGEFALKIKLPAVRKQMVTTKRTKLAAAYKAAFKDKNLTSLCLYSGPVEPDNLEAISVEPGLAPHDLTKIGWLGTGDAHLRDPVDIGALERAYGADIDHTTTFLFPHHGSINNTDPGRLVTDAENWVAAADPIHDWEHPHWRLRWAVSLRRMSFRHVRSPVATGFSETFLITPKVAIPA